jgi:hypothetical protein
MLMGSPRNLVLPRAFAIGMASVAHVASAAAQQPRNLGFEFVDFSQVRREAGSEWMWRPITALYWGMNAERFVPRNEYDGVLFIDTAHVPRYLYGPSPARPTSSP